MEVADEIDAYRRFSEETQDLIAKFGRNLVELAYFYKKRTKLHLRTNKAVVFIVLFSLVLAHAHGGLSEDMLTTFSLALLVGLYLFLIAHALVWSICWYDRRMMRHLTNKIHIVLHAQIARDDADIALQEVLHYFHEAQLVPLELAGNLACKECAATVRAKNQSLT